MDCRTSSISSTRSGLTLVELVIALAVAVLVASVIASLSMLFARSLATVINHVEIEAQSRQTLDTISREIRRATSVTAFGTNSITLAVASNQVTYAYDSGAATLTRVERNALGTVLDSSVFLRGCDSASFEIYQRNATNATYELFPSAATNTAKIVRLRWNLSRKIFDRKHSVETVNSARVVIRKKTT